MLFVARDGTHTDGTQPRHHPCWEVLAGRVGVLKPALRAGHARAKRSSCAVPGTKPCELVALCQFHKLAWFRIRSYRSDPNRSGQLLHEVPAGV